MCRKRHDWLSFNCVWGAPGEINRLDRQAIDTGGSANDAAAMLQLPHPRYVMFLAVLVLVGGGLAWLMPVERALVLGFDAGALLFLMSCLPLWGEAAADPLRLRAARDDGGRALLLAVSAMAAAAVIVALVRTLQSRDALDPGDLLTVAATLVLAWLFLNAVYAFHYAHLFYDQSDGADAGGLGFPGTGVPVFSDFCYLSFTIGMTCQTSDVTVETAPLRRAVMLHGVGAFFFNLGVLALVVNVLAGVL